MPGISGTDDDGATDDGATDDGATVMELLSSPIELCNCSIVMLL